MGVKIERKVVYEESYYLYNCVLDPSHPCWDGKENGYGACGEEKQYAVIQESENKFVVVSRTVEFDEHSMHTDEHKHVYSQWKKEAEFKTLEEAKQYIRECREAEEYKPEEVHNPLNYIE